MRFAVMDLKRNFDDGIKTFNVLRMMIGGSVKSQTVKPGAKGFALGQQLSAAAFLIGAKRRKHAPFACELAPFEAHRDFFGRLSLRGIEHVR